MIDPELIHREHRVVLLEGVLRIDVVVRCERRKARGVVAPSPAEVDAIARRRAVRRVAVHDERAAERGGRIHVGRSLHHRLAGDLRVARGTAVAAVGVLDHLGVPGDLRVAEDPPPIAHLCVAINLCVVLHLRAAGDDRTVAHLRAVAHHGVVFDPRVAADLRRVQHLRVRADEGGRVHARGRAFPAAAIRVLHHPGAALRGIEDILRHRVREGHRVGKLQARVGHVGIPNRLRDLHRLRRGDDDEVKFRLVRRERDGVRPDIPKRGVTRIARRIHRHETRAPVALPHRVALRLEIAAHRRARARRERDDIEPELHRRVLARRPKPARRTRQLHEWRAGALIELPVRPIVRGIGCREPLLPLEVPSDELLRHVAPEILHRAGFIRGAGGIEPDHAVEDELARALRRRGIRPDAIHPSCAVAGILARRFPDHERVVVIASVRRVVDAVVNVAAGLRIHVEVLQHHPVRVPLPPRARAVAAIEARARPLPRVPELVRRRARGRVEAAARRVRHRVEEPLRIRARVGAASAAVVEGHQEVEVRAVFVAVDVGRVRRLIDVVHPHLHDPAVPRLLEHLQIPLRQRLGHRRAVAVVVAEDRPEMVRAPRLVLRVLIGIQGLIVEICLAEGGACDGEKRQKNGAQRGDAGVDRHGKEWPAD